MSEKFTDLEIAVLNKIQNSTKLIPITSKQLCFEFNITFRQLKQVITSLREFYPIVSKETGGGGYWIAEDDLDVINFVSMIEARKRGYEETINKMTKYIKG